LQPESTSATKARRIGIRIRVLPFNGSRRTSECGAVGDRVQVHRTAGFG
jgi:hypothetical protein